MRRWPVRVDEMILFLRLLALASGLTLAFQPAVNARLRSTIGDPFWAATISFLTGTVALIVVALILRAPFPDFSNALRAPWYVWTGGLLGAIYVTSTIVCIPRLGAAQMLSLAVLGMMIGSLLIDQFGWFGLVIKPLSAFRVVGAILLVGGVAFMTRA